MADFFRADLRGSRFERVDLSGAQFRAADLADARFRGVYLHGVVMRGVELVNVDIHGEIENLTINGVDIAPLVNAELDRRYPDRAMMRPVDPAGFRERGTSSSGSGARPSNGHATSGTSGPRARSPPAGTGTRRTPTEAGTERGRGGELAQALSLRHHTMTRRMQQTRVARAGPPAGSAPAGGAAPRSGAGGAGSAGLLVPLLAVLSRGAPTG